MYKSKIPFRGTGCGKSNCIKQRFSSQYFMNTVVNKFWGSIKEENFVASVCNYMHCIWVSQII